MGNAELLSRWRRIQWIIRAWLDKTARFSIWAGLCVLKDEFHTDVENFNVHESYRTRTALDLHLRWTIQYTRPKSIKYQYIKKYNSLQNLRWYEKQDKSEDKKTLTIKPNFQKLSFCTVRVLEFSHQVYCCVPWGHLGFLSRSCVWCNIYVIYIYKIVLKSVKSSLIYTIYLWYLKIPLIH